MIDWLSIKGVLTDLVADLSGLGAASVRWRDEPAASGWTNSPAIYLRIMSVVGEGIEEPRREPNGLLPQTVVMSGQRTFIFSILVESFTQDVSDPNFAGNVCDRIGIRLMRPSSHERFAGLFAIQDRLPTKWMSYTSGDRQVSAYVLDVRMRAVDIDVDDSDGSGNWIGEAIIDGETVNAAGGPVSPQPHIDVVGT